MTTPFADVSCAALPPALLGALAELRTAPGVRVLVEPDRVWVRWERGDERVVRVLMPLPDAVLFAWRDGTWHRVGARLPAFDVPTRGDFRALHDVLFPAPVHALPLTGPPSWNSQRLRLVPDGVAKATTAILTTARELLAWADTVPAPRLRELRAARCDDEILLLGNRLPLLRGRRFWGKRVLRPLGFRVEPDLPESALCSLVEAENDDLLLLGDRDRAEVVPGAAFGPVTRAGLRRSAEEARR